MVNPAVTTPTTGYKNESKWRFGVSGDMISSVDLIYVYWTDGLVGAGYEKNGKTCKQYNDPDVRWLTDRQVPLSVDDYKKVYGCLPWSEGVRSPHRAHPLGREPYTFYEAKDAGILGASKKEEII